jgi:hypothetical protein
MLHCDVSMAVHFLGLLNPWVVRDSGRRVITTMTVTQRKGM